MRTIIIIVVLVAIAGLIYKVVTLNSTVAKADAYAGQTLPTSWKTDPKKV